MAHPAQSQPNAAGSDAYNSFDSPVNQNGDGRLSPIALANQQEQQRRQQLQPQQPQKPVQEQGMSEGRGAGCREVWGSASWAGGSEGCGPGQQPQVNRISPRGAMTAGAGGEALCLVHDSASDN